LNVVNSRIGIVDVREALGLLHVDQNTSMAYLGEANHRLAIAVMKGVPFFPIEVRRRKFTRDEPKKANIRKLIFWKAVEARSHTATLVSVAHTGKPIERDLATVDVTGKGVEIDLEIDALENGYWLTAWDLIDLNIAFGQHRNIPYPLAADELLETIRAESSGDRFGIVNSSRSNTAGVH
jgi:hypothetical protein